MRRLAALLASAVFLHACAQPPLRAVKPLFPLARPADADSLLRELKARRAALHSLRSLVRTRYSGPHQSHRAKQLILIARPDRLRAEVFSPFGTVYVVTTKGATMAVYSRREAIVFRGRATAENMSRYANLDMPVTDAIDLLLGTPPIRSADHCTVSQDGGYAVLQQRGKSETHMIWFGARWDPARYEQHDAKGRVVLRATFESYRELEGVRLPAAMRLELPPSGRRIEMEWKDPEVNPALADNLFTLDTPAGSKEVLLDGEAR